VGHQANRHKRDNRRHRSKSAPGPARRSWLRGLLQKIALSV